MHTTCTPSSKWTTRRKGTRRRPRKSATAVPTGTRTLSCKRPKLTLFNQKNWPIWQILTFILTWTVKLEEILIKIVKILTFILTWTVKLEDILIKMVEILNNLVKFCISFWLLLQKLVEISTFISWFW